MAEVAEILRTARSPVSLRKAILELRTADHDAFVRSASNACRSVSMAGNAEWLVQTLVAAGVVEYFIGEPLIFDTATALELLNQALQLDSSVPLKIARLILEGDALVTLEVKFHLLDILAHVVPGSAAAVPIAIMMSRAEPRVRSRAALALKGVTGSTAWVREHLQHEDARVRANAIEALWPQLSDEHEGMLRRALMDPANRVRGNALYALYMLGAEESRREILAMAEHQDPAFRSTAAWVMGETMDAEFSSVLERIARNDRGGPRMSALRALSRLRSRPKSQSGMPGTPPGTDVRALA
jgi:HEAT repeat protein